MSNPKVLTTISGNNADLISAVYQIYGGGDKVIADVTWGKGAFWSKIKHKIRASDLFPRDKTVLKADFRELPYGAGEIDIVVFDPPYTHSPGKRQNSTHMTNDRYNNLKSQKCWQKETGHKRGMYIADIVNDWYVPGMCEAYRVLKPGGTLWVKCKDTVQSGMQEFVHIDLYNIAVKQSFIVEDLFILAASSSTPTHSSWTEQYHARKNHSFLWIFRKPARAKQLELPAIRAKRPRTPPRR